MLRTFKNASIGAFFGACIGATIMNIYQIENVYYHPMYFIACISGAFLGILAGYKEKL
jgi:hypothetical protein